MCPFPIQQAHRIKFVFKLILLRGAGIHFTQVECY
jgi:hypothetical protein